MWTRKGKRLRYHGIAADGQAVHMYFSSYKKNGFTVWCVSLIIGVPRRKANDWHNKLWTTGIKSTGRGGLAPLCLALKILLEFADTLPRAAEIHIEALDERRMNVYRYLGRYSGWYWEPNENYIFYRNPRYWERTEEDKLSACN